MLLKGYWELDYRGKFIRTLWMVPIVIALIILSLLIFTPQTIYFAGSLFSLLIAQLVYNYKKWKGESNTD